MTLTYTMRFDPATEEGLVILACDPKRGIYASQTTTKTALKAIRQAGTLPTTASAHTLLTVALVNALRMVTRKDVAKMSYGLPHGVRKPRLVIISNDPTFLDAVGDFVSKSDNRAVLRAGRNFKDLLGMQLRKFDMTYRTEQENVSALVLGDWAHKAIISPVLLEGVLQSLQPSAVSFTV
jgi:hypothetical protein